jgi:hypothetical protein
VSLILLIAPGWKLSGQGFGTTHGPMILLLISGFLTLRELYLLGTVNNASKQRDEKLFYILEAAPELLAILLFTIPGLIPPGDLEYDVGLPTSVQATGPIGYLMNRR